MSPQPSCRAIARSCAAAAGLIGVVVLASWALEIDVLARVHPSLPPMVPNTALMAALLGAAIVLHGAAARSARHATAVVCGGVLLLSGLTLAQYVLGTDLRIDRLLSVGASEGVARFPGRPSPQAALALVLLAGAVLGTQARGRWSQRLAPALA